LLIGHGVLSGRPDIPAKGEIRSSDEFPFQEGADVPDRVEVLGQQFVVLDLDPEMLFQVIDELQNAGGIDDSLVEKGDVAFEGAAVAEQELVR
jgi:hypothetical protein